MSDQQDGYDEKVERLARKILYGTQDNSGAVADMESARRVARQILQESEERTLDNAAYDHEDDDAIRRSSSESAASGDTGGTRWVSDGE